MPKTRTPGKTPRPERPGKAGETPVFLRDHGKTACIAGGRQRSYADLLAGIADLAAAAGIRRGERAVIFSENRPEWLEALYAVWSMHGIAVPLDATMTAADLAFILKNALPAVAFCSEGCEAVLRKAMRLAGKRPRVLVLGKTKPARRVVPLVEFRPEAVDDTALIMYTSGTTGNPKGVMLSFDNLLANIECLTGERVMRSGDRFICLLPFHHILPLQGNVIIPLFLGATTVISPSLEKEVLFATMREHRATMVIAVPRVYQLFLQGIKARINERLVARLLFRVVRLLGSRALGRRLFAKVHDAFGGQVHTWVSGGAKLDPAVYRDLWALGFHLLDGYGATETAPIISFNRPYRVKIGTIGKALAGCEIRIEDGEILARGRNVMQGYYRNPGATARVLVDGWYRTGDAGHLDSGGRLHITGRKDELIVLPNGKNIDPEEIEKKIVGLSPLVREVGVIEEGGQLLALVYPDHSLFPVQNPAEMLQVLRESVIEKYNEMVVASKRVFGLHLVENELPRTRLGKLRRFLLKELRRLRPVEGGPVEKSSSESSRLLHDWLVALKGTAVGSNQHLQYDLGLDSLDRVELLAWIGRTFGMRLGEAELAGLGTVGRLAERIETAKTRIDRESIDWREILNQPLAQRMRTSDRPFIVQRLFGGLFRRFFRISCSGQERLPAGPFIIAANHQSYLDVPLLSCLIPRPVFARTCFWVKDSRFMARVVKLATRNRNIIVLDLEHDLQGAMQRSAAMLREGRNLLVFPEGYRARDGRMLPFKRAFAILARELQVPVVPVVISGAYACMPHGRILPRRGQIRLEILPAIKPGRLSYEALAFKVELAVRKRLGDEA